MLFAERAKKLRFAMLASYDVSAPKRVLVSEGSSLSAREAITALGMAGHRVGVCDPDPLCLGRFSRFVTHYYRCPPIGKPRGRT